MRNHSRAVQKKLCAAGLLGAGLLSGLAWLVLHPGTLYGQEAGAVSPHAEAWKDFQYQEASNCSLCHAGPTQANKGLGSLELVLMAEYSIWKTHDKHAQAYAVLEGKRGQQI